MKLLTQKFTKAGIVMGAGLLMLGVSAAHAEGYPERPIGVMVAYNPGGCNRFSGAYRNLGVCQSRQGRKAIIGWSTHLCHQ